MPAGHLLQPLLVATVPSWLRKLLQHLLQLQLQQLHVLLPQQPLQLQPLLHHVQPHLHQRPPPK